MPHADGAQKVGPAPLEIADIVGVIDQAGEIGVLIIDPHGQQVIAPVETAGRRKVAGKIGHVPSLTLGGGVRKPGQ